MKTELKMEPLSETMLEGTIVRWLRKEGDRVKKGETLLEVETDKALVEVASPVDGKVLRLFYEEGSIVPVGEVIAEIGDKDG